MKHKFNKLVLYFTVILCFECIYATNAEDAINHGTTYHWLARYKNSDSWDFLKSKEWFQKALEIIGADTTNLKNKKLVHIAKKGILESDIRWENNYDNITNEYPIFPILTKTNTTYEFYDDPDVVAAVASVENALQNFGSSIPREDTQLMTVVISSPKNQALEDEIRFSINNFGNYFYRPQEEQLAILSLEEINESYNFPESNLSFKIFNKLAKNWGKRYLAIFKLIENDIVDNVYYFGTWAYILDTEKNKIIKSIYADGFCEDRRDVPNTKLGIFIVSLIIALLVPTIIQFTYPIIFKQNKRPVFFYTSIFSLAITMLIFYPLTEFFNSWAPDPVTLALLPQNRFWIFSFLISLAIFPPIIVYVMGSKIPGIKDRLSDGESIACLAAGTLQGNLLSMALLYSTRYSLLALEYYYFISIITIVSTSQYFGYGMSNKFHKDKNRDLIAIPIYVLAAVLLMLALLRNEHLYILYSIMIGVVTPFIAVVSKYFSSHFKSSSVRNNTTEKLVKIDDSTLETILNNPPNYTQPKLGTDTGERLFKLMEHNNINLDKNIQKPNVVVIRGDKGVGKTRLGNIVSRSLIDRFSEKNQITLSSKDYQNQILYGDCDEANKDGAEVPFEPFSQAMHQILGAGRFEPPSQRANKIKSKMETLGLSSALDSTGLGLINNFLGNEDEVINSQSASLHELGEIICKTLSNLAKNLPVVFIIDDFHWIDSSSLDLFKNILRQVVTAKISNVSFILIEQTNPESMDLETDIINSQKELNSFINDDLINIISLSEENNFFLDINRFDEFLSHSIYFDTHSAHKLKIYFEKYEINNIDMVIRTVHHLHEIDALKFRRGGVEIKKRFSLSDMHPPSNHIDQIQESISLLDIDERLLLECSAVIGFEFNVEILAEALQKDRIAILITLRQLESKGFIEDILDQDDVYQFTSRSLMNGIRWLASKNLDKTNSKVSQIVREYHGRVAHALEIKYKIDITKLNKIKDKDIYALASRTFSAGETMAKKAIIYNIEALKVAKTNLRYKFAINFGQNTLNLLKDSDLKNIPQNSLEAILTTLELMIHTNLSPKKIELFSHDTENFIDRLNLSKEDELKPKAKFHLLLSDAICHDHSNYYSTATIKDIKLKIEKFQKGISPTTNSLNDICCQLGIIRLERKLGTDKKENFVTLLKEIESIKDIDDLLFYKKLKSEIIEDVLDYIIDTQKPEINIPELLTECISLKEEIDDQEGKTKLLILDGQFQKKKNKTTEAKSRFSEALNIAKNISSVDYISDINYELGQCAFSDEDYQTAQDYYVNAALQAKMDDNIPNQYNAIFGILTIAKEKKNINLIKEFSDEIQSLYRKDQKRGNKYKKMIDMLNACAEFSNEAKDLIKISDNI